MIFEQCMIAAMWYEWSLVPMAIFFSALLSAAIVKANLRAFVGIILDFVPNDCSGGMGYFQIVISNSGTKEAKDIEIECDPPLMGIDNSTQILPAKILWLSPRATIRKAFASEATLLCMKSDKPEHRHAKEFYHGPYTGTIKYKEKAFWGWRSRKSEFGFSLLDWDALIFKSPRPKPVG